MSNYSITVYSPTQFEKRCVLFNYPEFFPDKLIIGKFCAIAQGVQFMMGAANHRINSLSTYPFNVMGGLWREQSGNAEFGRTRLVIIRATL